MTKKEPEDICCIAAHGGFYFVELFKACETEMDSAETGFVLAGLLFLAHCHAYDEHCPLEVRT